MEDKWDGKILGLAKFDYKILEKPVPALKIVYQLPVGSGTSTNVDSALIRPFRKILNDGKPVGNINYVFLKDNDHYFVIGSFSYTEKHIIFFPGIVDRRLINFGETEYLGNNTVLHIDHFTLENNLKDWHVSIEEKHELGIKFPQQKTRVHDEHNFLWFILKIQSSDKLERCPKEFRITLYDTIDEIKRRAPVINDSRKNGIFQTMFVTDNDAQKFFWYLEFFVNLTQNRDNYPRGTTIIMPNSDTSIEDSRNEAPRRIHQIFLDGFSGSIFVRVSKIKGSIKHHMIFESGHNVNPSKKN